MSAPSAPTPAPGESASAAPAAEQVIRPPEGLARGRWEAPASAFYGTLAAMTLASALYAARRFKLRLGRGGARARGSS